MKTILIVDDEKDFCELIKETLELRGDFKVVMAHNGKDGIHQAKKSKPDLIILDLRMPGVDGFGALEAIKKNPSTIDTPVITLSALDDDASKVRCAQLYNDYYLTKPVQLTDLQAKIDEIFKMRE